MRRYTSASPLTASFIEQYQNDFLKRQERKRIEEKITKTQKALLTKEHKASIAARSDFITALKTYRKDSNYINIVRRREDTISLLKSALDYPSFDNIDIDLYFSIWELGHLIAIAIPAIKRHISELNELLKWLCDENIDIAVRYDEALNGSKKVEGISKAFISKVLVMHRPDMYYVKNDMTERGLAKYGLQTPRGTSQGNKYKATSNFLKQICKEANIENLAVLDHFLYLEGRS